MTRDLEILQAAQLCACEYGGENLVVLAFMKGAEWSDSHNPEIAYLEHEIERLKSKLQAADDLNTLLTAELEKAKSPWISVKERLPEITYPSLGESDFVFVRVVNKTTGKEWIELSAKYNEHFHDWMTNNLTWIRRRNGVVTHWMPIPEL